MDLYVEQIVDLSKNPLNRKALKKPSFTHSGVNTTCGDHIRIYVLSKSGKVQEASWEGDGCAISIAAASILTEEIKRKSLNDLNKISKEDLYEWLGIERLGPARVKCVTLSLETLQEALKK